MARPYSLDLRERVVAAVVAGESCRKVADICKVSVASVVKWSQRFRATGSVTAKRMGGHQPRSLAGERDWLVARLAAVPDLTLRALVVELGKRGVMTSYGSVWRIVHDAGISFKKTLFATEQDRPDVARRRAQWKKYQGRLDPARLVFIDETWAKTNMTRLCGWAPRGRKLLAKVPQGHWQTLTLLVALRNDRIDAPHASSTGRSTAKASWPMWNRFLSPRSSPVTLSSSTISGATRQRPTSEMPDMLQSDWIRL
jgi:transposase